MNYEEFQSMLVNTDYKNYMMYMFYVNPDRADIHEIPTGIFVSRDNRSIHDDYEINEDEKLFYMDKISEVMTEDEMKKMIIPGTIINPVTYDAMVTPQFSFNTRVLEDSENIRDIPREGKIYDIIDGTTINIYYLEGWRMGTKNSFGIEGMKEYGKTYFEYFIETCEKTNNVFDFDELDKDKVYTLTFSNPSLHMYASKHFVHCWGGELDMCPLEEIETPSFSTGYIQLNNNKIDIVLTENYSNMLYLAYHDRREHSKACKDSKEIMRRHLWSLMIRKDTKHVLSKLNGIFNTQKLILSRCQDKIQDLVYMKEKVCGHGVPVRFRSKRDPKTFMRMIQAPEFINFAVRMMSIIESNHKKV